jgi:hypothetical protein
MLQTVHKDMPYTYVRSLVSICAVWELVIVAGGIDGDGCERNLAYRIT